MEVLIFQDLEGYGIANEYISLALLNKNKKAADLTLRYAVDTPEPLESGEYAGCYYLPTPDMALDWIDFYARTELDESWCKKTSMDKDSEFENLKMCFNQYLDSLDTAEAKAKCDTLITDIQQIKSSV